MFPQVLPDVLAVDNIPPSLAVMIAAFVIEIVSYIGFSLISEHLFGIYRWLRYQKEYKKQIELKRDVVQLRRDLKSTSSMDEFAQWARLRSQVDGKESEYKEKTSSLQTARTVFLIKAQVGVRAAFYIMYLVVCYAYSTVAMFYIPEDWFGSIIGAMLALPWAPSGSVSVIVWMLACRRVCRNAMNLCLGGLEKLPEPSNDDNLKTE